MPPNNGFKGSRIPFVFFGGIDCTLSLLGTFQQNPCRPCADGYMFSWAYSSLTTAKINFIFRAICPQLAGVTTVWFEIQIVFDVLTPRLAWSSEFSPDLRRAGRIPPFHSVWKPNVDCFGGGVVGLGYDPARVGRNPFNHFRPRRCRAMPQALVRHREYKELASMELAEDLRQAV